MAEGSSEPFSGDPSEYSPRGRGSNRTTLSAQISMLKRFSPSWPTQDRLRRLPSTYTLLPLLRRGARVSPIFRKTLTLNHSVSSRRSPSGEVLTLLQATRKVSLGLPLWVYFSSPGAPRFPIIAALQRPAMLRPPLLSPHQQVAEDLIVELKASFQFDGVLGVELHLGDGEDTLAVVLQRVGKPAPAPGVAAGYFAALGRDRRVQAIHGDLEGLLLQVGLEDGHQFV